MDNEAFLRLKVEKISNLQEVVGELGLAVLSVTQNSLFRDVKSQQLINNAHRLELLMREVQDCTSGLRLVPVGELFRRMQRVVRDISAQTKKPADLSLEGEETELDKAVLDQLGDPLLHLLRNAIDHGISSTEDRIKRGKPAHGQVTLSATQKGREICISVADDGEGLDRQAILEKARSRGLLAEGKEPVDEEVWNMIFMPGFSTAKEVTNISGRGVGMDVVSNTIRSLRGRITIETQPGEGTRFNLLIPLTLAFLDCLIVEECERLYAIPIDAVSEVLCLDTSQIVHTSITKDSVVNWQGNWIPLYPLKRIYDEMEYIQGNERQCTGQIEEEGNSEIVVVVGTAQCTFGLPFEHVLGQQQVVIKPLSGHMAGIRGAAGCALLAGGEIAVVLDIDTLLSVMA